MKTFKVGIKNTKTGTLGLFIREFTRINNMKGGIVERMVEVVTTKGTTAFWKVENCELLGTV